MTTTIIYDESTHPGEEVLSDVFTVPSGGAAIRIKGACRAAFRAWLQFSDGNTVVYQGNMLELSEMNNVAMLVQPGDYRFAIINEDADPVQIEVRS